MGTFVQIFRSGLTPLHIAVQESDVETVKVLLAKGADKTAIDWKDKKSPLDLVQAMISGATKDTMLSLFSQERPP